MKRVLIVIASVLLIGGLQALAGNDGGRLMAFLIQSGGPAAVFALRNGGPFYESLTLWGTFSLFLLGVITFGCRRSPSWLAVLTLLYICSGALSLAAVRAL